MRSPSEDLELRLTPYGIVASLNGGGTDRACRAVASRFEEHEAAGLIALAAATLPPGIHGSAVL